MKRMAQSWALASAFGLIAWPALASAQPAGDQPGAEEAQEQTPEDEGMVPADELPPAEEDIDPRPPVPVPRVGTDAEMRVIRQAGVGSDVSYARAGVLELGGSAGLTAADDLFSISVEPSIGYFFFDNIQVTAIAGLSFLSAGDEDLTIFSALLEPSFHLPFSQTVFGFIGVGAGLAYADDPGLGFALAPRLGAKIMVGRSGVLTPAVQLRFNTNDAVDTDNGESGLVVDTALTFNVGYTVLW